MNKGKALQKIEQAARDGVEELDLSGMELKPLWKILVVANA